ncbi:fucose 4-O-acetylase-like acetyltransferase [Microterricola gilva]|uniref:Fucose 4-O-acetylase-like acetyltransferase n=1 Tax=Microterricola gilva TaxID=393267 RepID=A0A4Q8AHQ0_9MICO|nr:acyltransferase [Microterricola gilva]RZU63930.1 fucose 4-O-acetylase-like acetyltransferase [Microterricola gilva]
MTIAPERPSGTTPQPRAGGAAASGPNGAVLAGRDVTARVRSGRDASVDAVRAVLLVAVVALHAMMVGVSVGAGGPVLQNALEHQAWFAPVSWIVQVMPLFFVIGGFASITQWRGLRARGVSPASYVRGRIDRLVRPALALVAVVGAVLLGLAMVGMPAELVATAGFRIGQPLWFLGVYILCSALVPLMVAAHERARVAAPGLLLAAVVAVDVARMSSGVEAIGFLNLLFVWLLVQQFGFWLADGLVDTLAPRAKAGVIVAAITALLALTAGPYPADMFVNLNPPTVCLVLLGAAQLMVFSLLRGRISVLAERERVRRAIDGLGKRGMTVYIWHMPVLIALAAALLIVNAATGIALPEPLSAEWWSSRAMWLLLVGVAVAPAVSLFARFERGRRSGSAALPTSRSVALDALLGAGGVAVVLIAGFGPLPATAALTMLGIALLGSGRIGAALRAGWAARPTTTSSTRMTQARPAGDARALADS